VNGAALYERVADGYTDSASVPGFIFPHMAIPDMSIHVRFNRNRTTKPVRHIAEELTSLHKGGSTHQEDGTSRRGGVAMEYTVSNHGGATLGVKASTLILHMIFCDNILMEEG